MTYDILYDVYYNETQQARIQGGALGAVVLPPARQTVAANSLFLDFTKTGVA